MFFTWLCFTLLMFWASVIAVILDIFNIVSPWVALIAVIVSGLNSVALWAAVWKSISEDERKYSPVTHRKKRRNKRS